MVVTPGEQTSIVYFSLPPTIINGAGQPHRSFFSMEFASAFPITGRRSDEGSHYGRRKRRKAAADKYRVPETADTGF
jgi:hypothetical protein